nr:hypothetical protein [Tanacetum cinerariifolium]
VTNEGVLGTWNVFGNGGGGGGGGTLAGHLEEGREREFSNYVCVV